MSLLIYFVALLAPLALTFALALWVRSVCRARGILDQPGGRKAHPVPVPRLGGVAIFLGFSLPVLAGFALAPHLAAVPALRQLSPPVMEALGEVWRVRWPLAGLIAGGTIMFLTGLLDDLLGERLPTAWKLSGQSLAASVAVAAGVRVEFTGNEALNAIVSFLWILGISNAFNLLDNMDGLSAGVASISAAVFLVNAAELGEIFICLVLAALLGSLLAFLYFNFHPASLFMGDAGALFIGFILSSLTILEHFVSSASSGLFPVLMPPLVLAVPLLDTGSVVYIRLREGRPIYLGDRNHLSHRLVRCGLSQPQAVIVLFLVTLAIGLGALHLPDASPVRSLWILLNSILMAALLLWGVHMGSTRRATQAISQEARPSPRQAAEGI